MEKANYKSILLVGIDTIIPISYTMNKSSFKSRNNAGNMQRSNIGTVGMMRQQHSQQNNNMQQQNNMNQQHTNNMQQQMNQQQYNQHQQQYYQQQQLAQHHQQQQYNSQQHGGPQQGSVGMQHRGSVGMQHPQQHQMGGQGGMQQQQQMNNGQQQQNVVQQLNQKNHRLAKELVRYYFFLMFRCMFYYESLSLLFCSDVYKLGIKQIELGGFAIDCFYIVFMDILFGWGVMFLGYSSRRSISQHLPSQFAHPSHSSHLFILPHTNTQ